MQYTSILLCVRCEGGRDNQIALLLIIRLLNNVLVLEIALCGQSAAVGCAHEWPE